MSNADDPSDEAVTGLEGGGGSDAAVAATESPQGGAEVTLKQAKNSRKRTKTGCLTCRKRRIKCGEERPRCNNCVKSKRNCEGYNQRVIFKDPIHGYRTHVSPQHPTTTTTTFSEPSATGSVSAGHGARLGPGIGPQFPVIAPRPLNPYTGRGHDVLPPGGQGQASPGHGYPLYEEPFSGIQQVAFEHGDVSGNPESAYAPLPPDASGPYMTDPALNQYGYQHGGFSPASQHYQPQSASLTPSFPVYYPHESEPLGDRSNVVEWSSDRGDQLNNDFAEQFHMNQQHEAVAIGMDLTGQFTPDDEEQSDGLYDVRDLGDEEMEDGLFETRPAYDSVTGDYISSRLGPLLPLQPRFDDSSMRTFRTLLNEPNMLATYQPSPSASPLTDTRTARIFAHFVSATGPSLSIFERHPTDPSALFTDGKVPKARQNLWTYTIPMLALTHPPLMQAILAISSLHIAKLQGGSTISSLKHYHIAIMRLKKAVGLPSRRAGIGTLAATLLLGYYEVIGAEHGKWNSHLLGAKQLLREIDFAGITRQLKVTKVQEEIYKARMYDAGQLALGQSYGGHVQLRSQNPIVEDEVDESLVSHLMGSNLPYDQHGRVIDETMGNSTAETRSKVFTAKELRDFQVQSDLFWWFCKQDVFQSILSGNRLLMEYDRWGECLPRAPIGRLDSVYGTADHLFLLMGRLADFNARDVRRKKKVMDANGGQWKLPQRVGAGPPGGIGHPGGARGPALDTAPTHRAERHVQNGMLTAPPGDMGGMVPNWKGGNHNGAMGDPGPAGPAQGHRGPLPSNPPNVMLGMIPPAPAAKMPEGFTNGQGSPGSSEDDDQELEAATIEAEQEWEDIKQALRVFEESLGPDYKCLSSEYQQPLATPFGPAVYYRTYSIACIWAFYYTALIIHKRAHPSMPPAAMMAAGVAARDTATCANEIGRICAGLIPSNVNGQVSPALGGALCESVIPLFFAGVQYQHPGQRGYLVTKLREITRMTGWQTASAVAAGCETTWTTQGQLGRGPPYTRTRDPWAKDERVSGNKPGPLDPVSDTNSDRRFVQVNAGARVHWAIGIIGVEEDLKNLSVD